MIAISEAVSTRYFLASSGTLDGATSPQSFGRTMLKSRVRIKTHVEGPARADYARVAYAPVARAATPTRRASEGDHNGTLAGASGSCRLCANPA
jgi:hypothetical protein